MKNDEVKAELEKLKSARRQALKAFYGRENKMLRAYNGIVRDVTEARKALEGKNPNGK